MAILRFQVRTTNIAQLRDRLTHYLREVRAGEDVIIRDRQRPIAKIVPLTIEAESEDEALVAAGLMRKATRNLPATFWRMRRGAYHSGWRPRLWRKTATTGDTWRFGTPVP
jgi:prevent-host-death family protein